MVSIKFINKYIVLVVTFVTINLFGLYNFHTDQLWLGYSTYDIALLILNAWFVFLIFKSNLFLHIIFNKPIKYWLFYYLFFLLVLFSMPLRGEISILDAIRVGKGFLIIPLGILIFGWSDTEELKKFYLYLFLSIAAFTAVQIIVNAINPAFISTLFPHLRALEGYKFDLQRNNLISKSMLFPHMASLFYYYKVLNKKDNLQINFSWFVFYYIASSLQGFRSYFLSLTVILLFMFLYRIYIHKSIKTVLIMLVFLSVFATMDFFIFNRQITGKIATSFYEFEGKEGTAIGRYQRDQIFMIPMFQKKPLFGWGLINHNSTYGEELKISKDSDGIERAYRLYSVDSGYLSMLNMFGLIGTILILYFFTRIVLYTIKMDGSINQCKVTLSGGIIIMIISSYTHGAIYSDFGLLPLSIIIGIMQIKG